MSKAGASQNPWLRAEKVLWGSPKAAVNLGGSEWKLCYFDNSSIFYRILKYQGAYSTNIPSSVTILTSSLAPCGLLKLMSGCPPK
jgi:hypothetical protein